jgi:DNA (cytosine-5)-methyltransferase 1
MNVLELFAGIGGGILGHMLGGHRIVCAVELDPYCRSVLVRRQNDGQLPPFPIWDDIRTFDGRGWRDIVDMVSGGFPCNNISPAGDRTGITGEQSSLWFEMLRVVREVRPHYVFVENSAQLVRRGLDVVLEGLDASGYDAEWCVLGASDVGAPHIRKRCWVLAYANGRPVLPVRGGVDKKKGNERSHRTNESSAGITRIAGTHERGCSMLGLESQSSQPSKQKTVYPNTESAGCAQSNQSMSVSATGRTARSVGVYVPDSNSERDMRRYERLSEIEGIDGQGSDHTERTAGYGTRQWWEVEPAICRVVDGCPHRLDRVKGLGNAQVPLCAATAWKLLYERIHEEK